MLENQPAEAVPLRVSAQLRFAEKDYEAALEAFDELRRAHSQEAHYADRYAHCLTLLHRWRPARAAWDLALETHGVIAGRVNHLLRCYVELQDYAAAVPFLERVQDQVAPSPDFVVFSTIVCVGAGDVASAVQFGSGLKHLDPADQTRAVNALGAYLDRLVRQGAFGNVLWLLDVLLALLNEDSDTGHGVPGAAVLRRLWESRLRAAREMAAAVPDVPDGHVYEIEALLRTGGVDECRGRIAAFDARFARAALDENLSWRLEMSEDLADSRIAWLGQLAKAGEAVTFEAMSFRIAAFVTLRQYEQAIETGLAAIRLLNGHPRFKRWLGHCFEACGDRERALDWLGQAASGEDAPVNALIDLCRVQLKAGMREAALRTAEALRRRHPAMPAVRSLFDRLGAEAGTAEATPTAAVAPEATRGWLHGGDSGDLVYALSAVQGGGGGRIFLTCVQDTREPMNAEKIAFLAPLLQAQPYVQGVAAWQGEPVFGDFTIFRQLMLPDVDLATQHWMCVLNEPPDVTRPWLSVPGVERHGRPVFARSRRYRNRRWEGFWRELKMAAPDALFVGTAAEFEEFGAGEHYFADDALGLARVIAGASVFVGNQSLPYAIAEGLKVGRLQEVSTDVPNCRFPGALALRFGDTSANVIGAAG